MTATPATNVLPLAKPEAKTAARLLSAKDATKLYAKYKKDASWCVDMSGNFPILLHALSDRTATVQDIRLGFTQWANAEHIRVDCTSYGVFLASLPDRVMSLLPRVYGKGMRPCADRFIFDDSGIQLANIYNPAIMPEVPPPLPAPFDTMVDLFGAPAPEIVADLFARVLPDLDDRKFIVQRLAATIQTPEKRVKHAVFLVGDGGTGKSTVLDLAETALCRRHVDRSATYPGALDKHSEVLCNNRIVAFEDKAIGSGAALYTYTNLKQVIDYDRRTVNIKHGQRAVTRELHSSIWITTNNLNLFPWDANERRFYAPRKVVHLVSEAESAVFFAKFHTFLQLPESAAVLYHWLANVDLSGFDYGRCPRTPYMQELINAGGTMLGKCLDDFLTDVDIFHPKELSQYLNDRKQRYDNDELRDALELRGFEYFRAKFKLGDTPEQRFSIWRLKPPVGKHFRPLTDEEKAALMQLEGPPRLKTT
jgi:hypothetical protein